MAVVTGNHPGYEILVISGHRQPTKSWIMPTPVQDKELISLLFTFIMMDWKKVIGSFFSQSDIIELFDLVLCNGRYEKGWEAFLTYFSFALILKSPYLFKMNLFFLKNCCNFANSFGKIKFWSYFAKYWHAFEKISSFAKIGPFLKLYSGEIKVSREKLHIFFVAQNLSILESIRIVPS